MNTKKIKYFIIAVIFVSAIFAGCSGEWGNNGKISVVCTTFPQYDWARQIIGEENTDKFDLTFLINSHVDLHSYNPSVPDIAKIKKCDVFIYVGGHSDEWVDEVLKDANPDIKLINLIEILEDMGLIKSDEHEYEDDDHDGHEDEDEEHDEHIWLSLRNAQLLCAEIAEVISETDPENAQSYKNNLNAYTAKLSALDLEYQAAVDAAAFDSLVFADRFPFLYLTEDYSLNYYAAFHGCSAETEAGFGTIVSLANHINQLGLNAVMVTESSDQSIAKTVISETQNKNQKILVLDAVQSVTSADDKNGVTYLSIMENNLNVLKEALN